MPRQLSLFLLCFGTFCVRFNFPFPFLFYGLNSIGNQNNQKQELLVLDKNIESRNRILYFGLEHNLLGSLALPIFSDTLISSRQITTPSFSYFPLICSGTEFVLAALILFALACRFFVASLLPYLFHRFQIVYRPLPLCFFLPFADPFLFLFPFLLFHHIPFSFPNYMLAATTF